MICTNFAQDLSLILIQPGDSRLCSKRLCLRIHPIKKKEATFLDSLLNAGFLHFPAFSIFSANELVGIFEIGNFHICTIPK